MWAGRHCRRDDDDDDGVDVVRSTIHSTASLHPLPPWPWCQHIFCPVFRPFIFPCLYFALNSCLSSVSPFLFCFLSVRLRSSFPFVFPSFTILLSVFLSFVPFFLPSFTLSSLPCFFFGFPLVRCQSCIVLSSPLHTIFLHSFFPLGLSFVTPYPLLHQVPPPWSSSLSSPSFLINPQCTYANTHRHDNTD